MKNRNKALIFGIVILVVAMVFGFTACSNSTSPTSLTGPTARELADEFKTTHVGALTLKVTDINDATQALTYDAIVKDALEDFAALASNVQALLTAEKTLLDALKAKIDETIAASTPAALADAFTEVFSDVLDLTVDSVGIDDEAAVDEALATYEDLGAEAQALLETEKALLDDLKAQIAQLKAAVAAFRANYADVLALTVDTVTAGDETAVDAALAAYALLDEAVKAQLADEKALLDSLKTAIGALPLGSVRNPFQVDNVATLMKVGTETTSGGWTLSAHYIQTADIDMKGQSFTRICPPTPAPSLPEVTTAAATQ